MSANKPPQAARMAARDQAAALRAQQIARDKRKRMILIGLLIAGLLAFILVAYLIIQAGKDKPLDDLTGPSDAGSAPANVREDGGISFGENLTAGTDNGEDAVELATYLDFTCNHCGDFELTNSEDINMMLTEGETTLVAYPVAILGHQFSSEAAEATYYLADKSPEHVLEFINGVFTEIAASQTIPSADTVQQIALDAGVDKDVADKMLDRTWKKWVTAVTNDVVEREPLQRPEGGFATPTVTVDGTRIDPQEYNWTMPGQVRAAVEAARASN